MDCRANPNQMQELAMKEQVEKQLVDEAIEAYVDWREECAEVWNTYERWAGAPVADASGAFSAYRAALDREERASHGYADLLARIAAGRRPVGGLFARTVHALNR
jgi:hypothetical protein